MGTRKVSVGSPLDIVPAMEVRTEENKKNEAASKWNLCFNIAHNRESTLWLLLSGCFLILLRVLASHCISGCKNVSDNRGLQENRKLSQEPWGLVQLQELSEELTQWIHSFWTCLKTHLEIITNWWDVRSRLKLHVIFAASKHEPYYDGGSNFSWSNVTCNNFWNTNVRFIYKVLSYCYSCKIVSMWTHSQKSLVKKKVKKDRNAISNIYFHPQLQRTFLQHGWPGNCLNYSYNALIVYIITCKPDTRFLNRTSQLMNYLHESKGLVSAQVMGLVWLFQMRLYFLFWFIFLWVCTVALV